MNRRSFLKGFFAVSAVAAVAPEILIPDGKVFSFPSKIEITQPLVSYRTYLVGSDALMLSTVKYDDKKFIENLKRQLPFFEMCKHRPIPQASEKQIQLYMYQTHLSVGAV